MFLLICTVLTYSALLFLVIVLIGYWTGANYYFKIDVDFLKIFCTVNLMGLIFFIAINVNHYANTSNLVIIDKSYIFTGVMNMIIIILTVVWYLYNLFEKSRKYFWNKRGL